MPGIAAYDERLVEKQLLTLGIADSMFLPILVGIPGIPIKALTFPKYVRRI